MDAKTMSPSDVRFKTTTRRDLTLQPNSSNNFNNEFENIKAMSNEVIYYESYDLSVHSDGHLSILLRLSTTEVSQISDQQLAPRC